MIELWFDFSCPYAYLASRRAPTLGVPIDWRPMLLGGVFRGSGAGDGPMATLGPAKARHNLHDMHRWAHRFGVPFQLPAAHPMRTVRALRVLLALPRERWPAAIEAIFAAYWQRGEDVTSDEVIARAVRDAGVPDEEVTAALEHASSAFVKDELRRRTDEAIALGIFGAPAWITRPAGRDPLLIWGQDRMPFVEAALAGWDPDAAAPPGGPRALAATPARSGATLDIYFDASSPFSYLGMSQAGALAASGAQLRLVPISLGGLFRDIGQVTAPLLAMPPAKARHVGLDSQRWARWWGVPFDFPRKFPQRTITAQRLSLVAADHSLDAGIRLAQSLGRAMWAEQRDLEDDATLRAILERDGFPAAWLEQTQDPGVKARLIANTTAAKDAGVFGVPTYIVDGAHLFWGQDRIDLVASALAVSSAP